MKIQRIRRARGFTLIELLVVISIIAVLAAAGFAAGNAAIQKAKRTTALASAVSLETSVNNFQTEYGAMPSTATSDETVDTSSDGRTLLQVLLGTNDSQARELNPRGIKFLSVKEGKNKKKGGLVYNGNAISGLYDPWGGGFNVAMDCDYDEMVKPKGYDIELRTRVAVWTNGADGKIKTADDVKTW